MVRVSESQSDFFGPRWTQTYEEGGRYSVWIQPLSASNASDICRHLVDENPRNAYLREYSAPPENAPQQRELPIDGHKEENIYIWRSIDVVLLLIFLQGVVRVLIESAKLERPDLCPSHCLSPHLMGHNVYA